MSAAVESKNAAAANKERHVLAERYKTKMCRNYLQTGVCPYETRCMFAHGDHELRTSDMNVQDGLITEEAIKSWQRVLSQKNRQAAAMATAQPYAAHAAPEMSHDVCQCEECQSYYQHNPYSSYVTPTPYYSYGYNYGATCQCDECRAAYKAQPGAPMEP